MNNWAILLLDIGYLIDFELQNPPRRYEYGSLEDGLSEIEWFVKTGKELGFPIFDTQHKWEELHGRFLQYVEEENLIKKEHYDAFEGTHLDRKLKSMGIIGLAVVGFSRDGCVLYSIKGAVERGYEVVTSEQLMITHNKEYPDRSMFMDKEKYPIRYMIMSKKNRPNRNDSMKYFRGLEGYKETSKEVLDYLVAVKNHPSETGGMNVQVQPHIGGF